MCRPTLLRAGHCLIVLLVVGLETPVLGQTFTRDLQTDVVLNQIGFPSQSSKRCVLRDCDADEFQVIQADSLLVAFTGPLRETVGDFGTFHVGDFSEVRQPGTYYIKAGPSRSFPFKIAPNVYDDAIGSIIGYFALQQCGPSTTGYLAPCHCDDAVRMDNGRHQDTTGGWHDASDLRKWMGATIHGMLSLSHLYELSKSESLRQRILEELRWGNRYFLNMQEPAGFVMSHVGGDAVKHGDGNRWTDGVSGPEGGVVRTIAPSPGRSTKDITIVGEKDDRVIQTKPLDRLGQYKFTIAQARMARLTHDKDPAYSTVCLQAAKRCYDWCKVEWPEKATRNLGGGLAAAVELHRATGLAIYKRDAVACASGLAELQVNEPVNLQTGVRGFYQRSVDDAVPERDIWQGCFHLFGLCDLVELFPDDTKSDLWRTMIRRYSTDYLATMSRNNSFGIVPFGLYSNGDPGGNRRCGNFWYRYFMRPVDGWWVGINANLAATGVGLLRSAEVLDDPHLRAAAQRQLDWIVGNNPLGASTVVGIGRNQPPPFVNTVEFFPPTPPLPGAVMNGLGGTVDDQPFMGDGIYNVSEYWTPMVAYTVWLMALLQHEP